MLQVYGTLEMNPTKTYSYLKRPRAGHYVLRVTQYLEKVYLNWTLMDHVNCVLKMVPIVTNNS